MTELHAVVARHSAVAPRTRKQLTDVYHQAQHGPQFVGGVKEMRSINEEVPDEAPEITLPRLTAQTFFLRLRKILTDWWDLTATRDRSNMDAAADIRVDGEILAEGVPVPTLLSLEKWLTDLRTVVEAMPVRDPSKIWRFDADQGFYRAPEMRKAKTRKVTKGAELSAATDKFPANAIAVTVDEVVGHYVATEFSGAQSAQERDSIVDRLNGVIDAVKIARTEANKTEVTDVRLAAKLLDRIFVG